MGLDRPAIDADGIRERGTAEHVLAAELIAAGDALGVSRMPSCGSKSTMQDFSKPGTVRLYSSAVSRLLAASFDLAAGEIVGLDAVDGAGRPRARPA